MHSIFLLKPKTKTGTLEVALKVKKQEQILQAAIEEYFSSSLEIWIISAKLYAYLDGAKMKSYAHFASAPSGDPCHGHTTA